MWITVRFTFVISAILHWLSSCVERYDIIVNATYLPLLSVMAAAASVRPALQELKTKRIQIGLSDTHGGLSPPPDRNVATPLCDNGIDTKRFCWVWIMRSDSRRLHARCRFEEKHSYVTNSHWSQTANSTSTSLSPPLSRLHAALGV